MPNPVAKPEVSQGWGRPNPRYSCGRHTGTDFACKVGTPLLAVADGKIIDVMNDKSYGLVVVLQAKYEGVEYHVWYCHMSKQEVKKGQTVKVGDHLGLSGNTGNSTGPHLHLETRIAPFRYGNDVSCPFVDLPASVDANAPADRKVGIWKKAVAKVTPAGKPATKNVVAKNVTFGASNEDVKLVQSGLHDLVDNKLVVNGKYDDATKQAYKKWQESLGYKGNDADGIAGAKSLSEMGKKYGFKVV